MDPNSIISIVGTVAPFLAAIFIILIIFLSKTKREKYRNDVLKAAIENGRDIPSDFFKKPEIPAEAFRKQDKPKANLLTTSLFFLGFGIGISLAFYFFFAGQGEGLKFGSIGLVFIFVGLGQLVAYQVERKQKKSGEQEGL
jgi:hypothetical protein